MTPADIPARVWLRLLGKALGLFTRADMTRAGAPPEAHPALDEMLRSGEARASGGQFAIVPRAPLPVPEAAPKPEVRIAPPPAPRGQLSLLGGAL